MADIESTDPSLTLPNQDDVIIAYIKEKDVLKAELVEKDKEIQRQKSKIYDLSQKLDDMKKEMKNLRATKQSSSSRQLPNDSETLQVPLNKLGVSRPNTGKARTPAMSKRAKSSKQRQTKAKSSRNTSTRGTPDGNAKNTCSEEQENAIRRIEFLENVAAEYPELKLSVVLESEKFFNEGDINSDGTIDEEELEKSLIKQGHLFTSKELKEIMSQIDVDNNQSIDIMEYLAVMEKVQQRKRVNLPSSLTKSTVCLIQ